MSGFDPNKFMEGMQLPAMGSEALALAATVLERYYPHLDPSQDGRVQLLFTSVTEPVALESPFATFAPGGPQVIQLQLDEAAPLMVAPNGLRVIYQDGQPTTMTMDLNLFQAGEPPIPFWYEADEGRHSLITNSAGGVRYLMVAAAGDSPVALDSRHCMGMDLNEAARNGEVPSSWDEYTSEERYFWQLNSGAYEGQRPRLLAQGVPEMLRSVFPESIDYLVFPQTGYTYQPDQ